MDQAGLKTEISKTPVPSRGRSHLSWPCTFSSTRVRRCSLVAAARSSHGGWSVPSARPAARWTASRPASGTTLRHYFASLLIASGADVKTVQARLRHASAKTTLDTYRHLWPDHDESTRAAVEAAFAARADSLRTTAGQR